MYSRLAGRAQGSRTRLTSRCSGRRAVHIFKLRARLKLASFFGFRSALRH
jgi:hypothetical protein